MYQQGAVPPLSAVTTCRVVMGKESSPVAKLKKPFYRQGTLKYRDAQR
jgi:hypothetical protein